MSLPTIKRHATIADMTDDTEKKRQLMRAFMTRHKLKVTPWAKKAGVSRGAINHFLNGKTTSMTAANLEKLAAAVGASVTELLGDDAAGTRAAPTLVAQPTTIVDDEALRYAIRSVLRAHIAAKKGNLDTEDLGELTEKVVEAYRMLVKEQPLAALA